MDDKGKVLLGGVFWGDNVSVCGNFGTSDDEKTIFLT